MNHELDPNRRIYRTELPKAGWFTYVLMFVMAFVVGAAGGTFAAFRFGAGREMRRVGRETLEPLVQDYSDVTKWAIIGGVLAMMGLAGFLMKKDEE